MKKVVVGHSQKPSKTDHVYVRFSSYLLQSEILGYTLTHDNAHNTFMC